MIKVRARNGWLRQFSTGFIAAMFLGQSLAAAAESKPAAMKPVVVPEAATLIGKRVDPDRQYAIGQAAKQTKSGDWSYGFGGGAEGELQRQASVTIGGAKKSVLAINQTYEARCNRADKAIDMSLDDGVSHFKATQPKNGESYSTAWIVYSDNGAFDPRATKTKLSLQEIDATYLIKLDAEPLAHRGQIAFCPSQTTAKKPSAACSIFSLKGFARAFDYVCDAK
jgi:hypothetical protein